jgi:DNA repair photolyase
MYGVLKMDHNSPLCCVSEANNSFSIDYWKGCSFQCGYCHVQGIYEDLDENYKMYKSPIPRSRFTIEEIIDELVKHPYFEKDVSIISIATSSTEPFANEKVTESTLRIMEYFVSKGYKNPFWIVTKAGIPKGISDRLKNICDNGNKIMISMCYAGNPKNIEPMTNNRFRNIESLKGTGVTVSWYLRPLVKEWGANYEHLEEMIKYVSENYADYIDMIVPGGLRWTEGIEFGLKVQRGQEMPELIKEHDKKTLSNDIENDILKLCNQYFPNLPVYFNSSCAISHMLNTNNIALLNILKPEICNKSKCYNKCKEKCSKRCFTKEELLKIQEYLKQEGLRAKLLDINCKDGIVTEPPLDTYSYTVKQQMKKTIAKAILKLK